MRWQSVSVAVMIFYLKLTCLFLGIYIVVENAMKELSYKC